MTIQCYDALPGKLWRKFFRTLSVHLYGVCTRNWNSERVIIFQSVILQRVQGVNNYAQICKSIFFWFDCCNRGAFSKLVKEAYNSAMGYLGKARGVQTEEQCHQTFSNFTPKWTLCKAVQFVYVRENGGFFQTNKLAEDCMGMINETVTSVLEGKHKCKKTPPMPR